MAADQLACGLWTLLGLWGDTDRVHMAVLDGQSSDIGILSLECPGGSFPSIGMRHAPAIRLERAIHDLFGYDATGLPDRRAWLDHGRWGVVRPLGARTEATPKSPHYCFLPTEGEGMHQIPVGPVHAGIIEPGHFRFTANGETVIRLEERLGYVHKGIENSWPVPTSTALPGLPVVSPGTAPLPMHSPSRGRPRQRSESRCPHALVGCAGSWQNSSASPITSATSGRL
jgi:hypothetical protein